MSETPRLGRSPQEPVGVIGGTGFYKLLDNADPIRFDTPYGPPSDPPVLGEISGRPVAFLPRHGADHRYPPHQINYRANLWALHTLRIRQILAPSAVGSLLPHLRPGTLVIPDQLVDRTEGRAQTFFDGPETRHTSFADPYCPTGREISISVARHAGWETVSDGTLVVIQGPRFSTRAESQWYAGQGWDVIGMTAHPEAVLARELGICYTTLGLITDLDAGIRAGEGVTQDEIFRVFRQNVTILQRLVTEVVASLPARQACSVCEPD